MSAPACWVDGRPVAFIPADDRGFAYGDGVFETVLLVQGRPVWWEAHLSRLEQGAAVLGIVPPERGAWQRDLAAVLAARPALATQRAVLKLVLTRGSGARGYAVAAPCRPRRVFSVSSAPEVEEAARYGWTLRWCRTTLAIQPALAGLKHLNRLEQVLARREWSDPAIDEGLMCDTQGRVISAVAGNLLCLTARGWFTPALRDCGIRGVCRGALLDAGLVHEAELRPDEVLDAEALAVCNSVRGILPVRRLEERGWQVAGPVRTLQRALAAREPAFAHSFLDDPLA